MSRYHLSGVAGAGMSPLACLLRARGHYVQGSDRSFEQGKNQDVAARLEELGIRIVPHDGTAINPGIERFVHSTAIEADTPEMRAAHAFAVECVPRPQLLAEVVNAGQPGVAIAGTSGKSTVTGMIAWLLRESAVPATALGGAALVGDGGGACFVQGPAHGPVVAEACESDGTLVGYRPAIGLIHNVSRDHGELEALRPQFATFAERCGRLLVNAGCPEAAAIARRFKPVTYGASPAADAWLEVRGTGPHRALGVLHREGGDVALDVPQPGLHNLDNAAAAAMVALELGLEPPRIAALLARFPGVARRYEVIGVTARHIRVVDDYAHNGEKLRAAIATAQAGAARVLVVFQPHGYGPARFLRPELRTLLPELLRSDDRLCYLEIFYAGGTVARDISSRMLAADLPRLRCGYAADHVAARDWVVSEARPGDTVLVCGARDPDLPHLARSILRALQP